ncbi:MAG: Tfp pilus assembly protein FimT/FimU [Rhodoferax sp.]
MCTRFSNPAVSSKQRAALQRGFTAIELLITIAVLGILLAIAMPAMQDFVTASRSYALSTDFVADMQRARQESIAGNVCVKICQSANAEKGGAATCATSGDDWQRGWILFRNPNCDTSLNNPTDNDMIGVHRGTTPEFTLQTASGSARRYFVYYPNGVIRSSGAAMTGLSLLHGASGASSKHSRSLCISQGGRVTVRPYGGLDGCN